MRSDAQTAKPGLTLADRRLSVGKMNNPVSLEEFPTWFTPRQAIAETALSESVAVRELIKRLEHGLVIGSAETASWPKRDGTKEARQRLTIPAAWWGKATGLMATNNDLWTTGRVTFHVNDGIRDERTITCFGVRFRPFDVISIRHGLIVPSVHEIQAEVAARVIAPLYRAKPAANKAQSIPKATREELSSWLQANSSDLKNAVFDEIAAKARDAIPNRRITRQPLRDAIGELKMTKNRGNPTIRRK
jgi:hypothetical protein